MPLDKILSSIVDTDDIAAALMSKKARKKLTKSMKKLGGIAAVAGLGYAAYQSTRKLTGGASSGGQNAGSPPPLSQPPPLPQPPPLNPKPEDLVSECLRMNMVLAMIAAAGADGQIDEEEMKRLGDAIEKSKIDEGDKAKLIAALNRPPTVEHVAALAIGPMEACELYGAALTAIEVDTPAERLFMQRFAAALRLDDQTIAAIRAGLED